MGELIKIETDNAHLEEEQLHIKRGRQNAVTARLTIAEYIDKDTKQYVLYIPSLELTGYGETLEKADQMIKFSLDNFFDNLCSLPTKKAELILRDLGWKHNTIKHKDYSKTYVDVHGNLKGFAVEDKVKVGVLTV